MGWWESPGCFASPYVNNLFDEGKGDLSALVNINAACDRNRHSAHGADKIANRGGSWTYDLQRLLQSAGCR